MVTRLQPDETMRVLRTAFAPLQCEVKSEDYNQTFTLQVIAGDGTPIVSVPAPGISAAAAREPRRLEGIVCEVRDRVVQKGFVLDAWQMPPFASTAA